MPIRHVYTSPQADVGDPTLVQPSDWNSAHAYTLQDAVSLSGNTAGVLANISTGTAYLAGGNNVTLSQDGNSVTISAFNQTAQTQNRFNLTLSGNTDGVMAQVSSGTLTLAGGNNITLSQNGNAVTVSGQTAPPIGTAVKAIASVGSTGTITRFAPEDHQHAGVFSAGVSTGGNTAGDTAVLPGRLVLAGGDNVTLSMATAAGNLMTVSVVGATAAGGAFKAGISTDGNTAGTTGTVGSQLVLVGGSNVTLSQSVNGASATVTINQSNPGQLYYLPTDFAISTTVNLSNSQSTIFLVPFIVPCDMTMSRVIMLNSGNFQTQTFANNNTTFALTISRGFALYSFNGQSLARHTSVSDNIAVSWTSNIMTASLHSVRVHTAALNATLSPGNWWMGFSYSSAATRSGAAGSATTLGNSYYYGRDLSVVPAVAGYFSVASDTNVKHLPYSGYYGTASAAFPSSIASTDVVTDASINLWFRLDGAIPT